MKYEVPDDVTPETGQQRSAFLQAVIEGLAKRPASIPAKFFYDSMGSDLFERICETPEYYLSRTEQEILQRNLCEIAEYFTDETLIIEPGAGSAIKVRPLIEAVQPKAYIPIDIAEQQLLQGTAELANLFPSLRIHPHCGDFNDDFAIPKQLNNASRLFFFPGSTIGNFEPADTVNFLNKVYRLIAPGGALLIGIDLIKDPARLNAAYNDAGGLTARFNLNLLARMQRELGAELQIEDFSHYAIFNPEKKRVEMFLISQCNQTIRIGDKKFEFAHGEPIHTENSYKYDRSAFETLVKNIGFSVRHSLTDAEQLFGVYLLTPR